MAHAPREDILPWYKQFWPWFLISIPAATVVAGLVTFKIAATNPDTLVVDDYYKEGLAINKDISREKLAKTLGVGADLAIDPDTRELRVRLSGKLTDPPMTLDIAFFHPRDKERDVQVKLTHIGDLNYSTRLPELEPLVWKLTLTPENKEWKLAGKLSLPADKTLQIK